jgi:hypothetical protein
LSYYDYILFILPTNIILICIFFSIALFELKNYQEAKNALESSKELNPNEKSLATWLKKTEAELEKSKQNYFYLSIQDFFSSVINKLLIHSTG